MKTKLGPFPGSARGNINNNIYDIISVVMNVESNEMNNNSAYISLSLTNKQISFESY